MAKPKNKDASSAAITGAGSVAAGTGLVAGGIPGVKPNFNAVFQVKPGQGTGARRVASEVRGKAPLGRAVGGGIIGFRRSAHELGTHFFREQAKLDSKTKPKNAADAFYRGRNAGKIGPEEKVMRGLKAGHMASHGLLAAGAGTAAYGIHRGRAARQQVKKSDNRSNTYNGTLLGVGTAGAVASHGGAKFMDSKKRSYAVSAGQKVDAAEKLVPGLGGRKGQRMSLRQMNKFKQKYPGTPFPKSMYPSVSDSAVKTDPSIMHGVGRKTARKAGQLRGAAAQERHFSEVFGNTGKVIRGFRTPSAIVGAAGAAGLVANREKVKKSMNTSAFGVDHG